MMRVDNQLEGMVSGVFEPLPAQSSMHPDFLISFATLNDDRVYGAEQLRTNWGNNSFSTFLLLPENYDPQQLVDAFPAFQNKHRSEEHTSELQSLMRISYAVFCLKKKIRNSNNKDHTTLIAT